MRFFKFINKLLPSRISRNAKEPASKLPEDFSEGRDLDQRGFSRHWVSFPVIISREDFTGAGNQEKTILKDISGGGALFESGNPDNYYPGQLLKISIMLDGSNDVKARIRTEATVIRIHDVKTVENRGGQQAAIAVQFDRSFEFERIDYNDFG